MEKQGICADFAQKSKGETKMNTTYELHVAGLTRQLPLCSISEDTKIAAFVIFGDVELTEKSAAGLIEKMPPHDIVITAEAKGIPLVHEIARQNGETQYLIARKAVKLYMVNPHKVSVRSITTDRDQELFIDQADMDKMKGKRVIIVDDVISTGESLRALEELVAQAGGQVVGKMAILAEGSAKNREDIICLEYLPMFDKDGNPMEE